MKRFKLINVFLLTGCLFLTAVEAEGAKPGKKVDPLKVAQEFTTQANDARKSGNLDKALELYQKAFNIRYKTYGHRDTGTIQLSKTMAEIYREKKDYDKAQSLLLWSTKALVKVHGNLSYQEVPILLEYAKLFEDLKKFEDAMEKQKVAVSLIEKKDDSNPALYGLRVDLARMMAKNADYEQAQKELKIANLLASDYQYEPSAKVKEELSTIEGYIKDRPFQKVVKKPVVMPKPTPEPAKEEVKTAVKLPEVKVETKPEKEEKPLKIIPTELEELDTKTIVKGPLSQERAMLLEFISKSGRYGIGVKNYVAAFDRIEAMVTAEWEEAKIKKSIDSLTNALQQQFQRRYALAQRKPAAPKKRKGLGLIASYTPIKSAPTNDIVDKYANTPLTEGYLKQIEREVVQAEMARHSQSKYWEYSNAYYRDIARREKRKRINNWRNREQRMDFR